MLEVASNQKLHEAFPSSRSFQWCGLYPLTFSSGICKLRCVSRKWLLWPKIRSCAALDAPLFSKRRHLAETLTETQQPIPLPRPWTTNSNLESSCLGSFARPRRQCPWSVRTQASGSPRLRFPSTTVSAWCVHSPPPVERRALADSVLVVGAYPGSAPVHSTARKPQHQWARRPTPRCSEQTCHSGWLGFLRRRRMDCLLAKCRPYPSLDFSPWGYHTCTAGLYRQ